MQWDKAFRSKIVGTLMNFIAIVALSGCEAGVTTSGTSASSAPASTATGSNISGANGARVIPIPAGIYDGMQTATAVDVALLAANIRSGSTIFGVAGSMMAESHSNCSGNAQTGCVATASFVSGVPAAANFNGTSGQRVITPPAGYYDGSTKTVTANDTNLAAGNILSGVSIFGVTGNVTGPYSACTDNALNADKCSTAANRYVASALGGAVNGVNGSLSHVIPQGYYDGTTSATMSDTSLTAGNVCTETTVFGTLGSAPCYSVPMSSALRDAGVAPVPQLAGQTISLQISQQAEVTTYAGAVGSPASNLPTGAGYNYREVPDQDKDDDGYLGTSSNYAPRPGQDCGLSGSITTRIADCYAKNGCSNSTYTDQPNCIANGGTWWDHGTWDGAVQGNAGQGKWRLVTRNGANKEVWRDERTQLVWSSKATTTTNWCQASGNQQWAPVTFSQAYNTGPGTQMVGTGTIGSISGGSLSATETVTITFSTATAFTVTSTGTGCTTADGVVLMSGALTGAAGTSATYGRTDYCSFTLTQGSTPFAANDIFILKSTPAASYSCAPGAGSLLQPASPVSYCAEVAGAVPGFTGETWGSSYPAEKGGMGKGATDKVRWRLPTKYDYQQADNDGIRMVMPDMGIAGTGRPHPDGSPGGINEWSASLAATARNSSWVFNGPTASFFSGSRSLVCGARCVGR